MSGTSTRGAKRSAHTDRPSGEKRACSSRNSSRNQPTFNKTKTSSANILEIGMPGPLDTFKRKGTHAHWGVAENRKGLKGCTEGRGKGSIDPQGGG